MKISFGPIKEDPTNFMRNSNLFKKKPGIKLNIKDNSPINFSSAPKSFETDDIDLLLNSRFKDRQR